MTRGQRLLTFATAQDWFGVLDAFEREVAVKYVSSGMSKTQDIEEFPSFAAIRSLGGTVAGDAIQGARYLVLRRESPVFSRAVSQRAGGVRYSVDHSNNPDSIVFSPGGLNEAERALISGEVSKLSRAPTAERLYKALSSAVKEHFVARGAYRVGTEAMRLKEQGYRLTANIGSPRTYDLA